MRDHHPFTGAQKAAGLSGYFEWWSAIPLRDRLCRWEPREFIETWVELMLLRVAEVRRLGREQKPGELSPTWDAIVWHLEVYEAGKRRAFEACRALGVPMPFLPDDGEPRWARSWCWPHEHADAWGDDLRPVVYPSDWSDDDGDLYGAAGRRSPGDVLVLDVAEVRAIIGPSVPVEVVAEPVNPGEPASWPDGEPVHDAGDVEDAEPVEDPAEAHRNRRDEAWLAQGGSLSGSVRDPFAVWLAR